MDNHDKNTEYLNNKKSNSIELSEADFLDAGLRTAAISKLIKTFDKENERTLIRPRIDILQSVLNISIPLLVASLVFWLLHFCLPKYHLKIVLGGLGLYVLIRLRSILIWFIFLYQHFAPAETRLRCVYVPSCSEYAILALKKYGIIRGVPKILSRLKKCHPPNSGNDPLV